MYKSNSENTVEEIQTLMNQLDINSEDAIEIINIYFECFSDVCSYNEFLMEEIRIIRQTEYCLIEARKEELERELRDL